MTDTPDIIDTSAYLSELHRSNEELLRQRIERARTDGQVPESISATSLASLIQALWYRLSAQSNQGVSRDELLATADLAITNLVTRVPHP